MSRGGDASAGYSQLEKAHISVALKPYLKVSFSTLRPCSRFRRRLTFGEQFAEALGVSRLIFNDAQFILPPPVSHSNSPQK